MNLKNKTFATSNFLYHYDIYWNFPISTLKNFASFRDSEVILDHIVFSSYWRRSFARENALHIIDWHFISRTWLLNLNLKFRFDDNIYHPMVKVKFMLAKLSSLYNVIVFLEVVSFDVSTLVGLNILDRQLNWQSIMFIIRS